jgi:hypothetical protein
MTQPTFVPIPEADQVRPSLQLEAPRRWTPSRPGELRGPGRPAGTGFGTPGPDQGYALLLARRFEDRLRLGVGESTEDVVVGCASLACRRSGLFGRAPSVYDIEVALNLFGYLTDASPAIVADRSRRFASAAHDYARRQALVASVPEESLRLTPGQVAALAGGRGGPLGIVEPGE